MLREKKKRLILRHRRHLQKLQEQRASFGLHTPAHIVTEIEDTEAEIEKLEIELGLLDGSPESKSLDEITGTVSWLRIAVGGIIFAVLFGTIFLLTNWYAKPRIEPGSTVIVVPTQTSAFMRTSTREVTSVTDVSTITSPGCTPSPPHSEFPPQSIAIIEPDNGPISQVPLNTLKYENRSGLSLASGITIDFRQMKSFELSNKISSPTWTADVVVIFLNCKTHQDVIKSESGSFLTGDVEFGPLKLHILDLKRVDFLW